MRDDEWHQMMLERQQRLEEALDRAEAGRANEEDWVIIRFECGVARRPVVILETLTFSRSE